MVNQVLERKLPFFSQQSDLFDFFFFFLGIVQKVHNNIYDCQFYHRSHT